jgi:hypothetical protein
MQNRHSFRSAGPFYLQLQLLQLPLQLPPLGQPMQVAPFFRFT